MICIHIGLRKSGSTTIQDFLSANADALRSIGVDYPSLGRGRGRLSRTAHQNLQCQLRRRRRLFDPAAGTIEDMAAYWRRSDAHTLILSCEGFEECPADEARILKSIARAGEEVRIVLIVRDLLDLMPSSYGQKIKFGWYQYDFDTFFRLRMKESRVHYFTIAESWAEAFGWENLRVRLLDRAHLLNGDLVDDFLSVVGVDPASEAISAMPRPGASNVTPGWRVLEAIRALYGGHHGLEADHPLFDARNHDIELRHEVGFCAMDVGERWGWNKDRGQYLTKYQAGLCLEAYARSIEAINRRVGVSLPPPRTLAERDFAPRKWLPDASRIDPARLQAFYDTIARRLIREHRLERP